MRVQFGEYTLDSDARRLIRRDATEVHLSTKAFDLLQLLIERRPNLVDKASLHAEIWPRTFVVDANLTVLVAELRRALGDSAREPRFIRTVHAHGYSFCGDIVALETAKPFDPPARCWLTWNGRTIVLAEGDNIIGRDPDCQVWVDASGVSRRHARISVTRAGDVVRLDDLGSKNGTCVDGLPISGSVRIADGSLIQVGVAELTLRVWSRGKSQETERIAR